MPRPSLPSSTRPSPRSFPQSSSTRWRTRPSAGCRRRSARGSGRAARCGSRLSSPRAGSTCSSPSPVNRLRWLFAIALLALVASQSTFNSGDSERQAVVWLSPLVIVFGAGFFFVLLSSNPVLGTWPRACAAALIALQAVPLAHDALDPHWLHFQYPPYFPQLFQGMRRAARRRPTVGGRYGLMADVPAGLAWYGQTRVWAQPATLRDFYAVQVEQPTGELLLTPKTLDRPFFSDLNAKSKAPSLPHGGDPSHRRVGRSLRRPPDGQLPAGISALDPAQGHRGSLCPFQFIARIGAVASRPRAPEVIALASG